MAEVAEEVEVAEVAEVAHRPSSRIRSGPTSTREAYRVQLQVEPWALTAAAEALGRSVVEVEMVHAQGVARMVRAAQETVSVLHEANRV